MYRSYWWARNNKLSFGERIDPPRAGENTLGAAVCRDEPLWRFDLTAASVEKNLALWTRVPGGRRNAQTAEQPSRFRLNRPWPIPSRLSSTSPMRLRHRRQSLPTTHPHQVPRADHEEINRRLLLHNLVVRQVPPRQVRLGRQVPQREYLPRCKSAASRSGSSSPECSASASWSSCSRSS